MPAWTPALATGDDQIDGQHKEIFRRVDALHAAMLRGDRQESVKLFEFLGGYVADHFGAEERAMRDSAYPEFTAHKEEHRGFVRAYLSLSTEFREHGPTADMALKLKAWLTAWLNQHILKSDLVLAAYLVRRAFVLDDL